MATYKVTLLEKKQIADGTMEFMLSKPDNFAYQAGQFFSLILPKPSEETRRRNYVHTFSYATAPYEANIAAATRMRADSIYKNAIKEIPVGSELEVDGSWGDFVLNPDETAPVVYIIGGIGVTPVRSMVAQATKEQSSRSLTLLYANNSQASAAYLNDFEGYAKQNSNFKFVPIFSEEAVAGAEQGRVSAELVKRHVNDVHGAIYYLSGPAGMVEFSRDLLIELGVAEDNIRTEEFSGY